MLSKTGDTLTASEWVYVKKILIHNNNGFFNCKQFQQFISSSISKQGASKFLNKFVMYDILRKQKNKKGEIIYSVNNDILIYSF